jgi:hypothetical protein
VNSYIPKLPTLMYQKYLDKKNKKKRKRKKEKKKRKEE